MNTFEDERGKIIPVCERADVLRITSKRGSRRAGHYHRTTGHWSYVTKGEIVYFERPVGSSQPPSKKIYIEGDLFYTGPRFEHLMLFENFDENEFLCFSTGKRDQESYENDLVRLNYDLDKCV